jgi:multimeric flavodoxin WrbA
MRDKRKIGRFVVGISGSPARGGATEAMLDNALDGARSRGARILKVCLNGLRYRPCQGCGGCLKTGRCVIADDMGPVYALLKKSDSVIVASPVYFGSITAQLKSMLDRLECLWVEANLLRRRPKIRGGRRRGYFICSGGSHREGHFADAERMAAIIFNTINVKYSGSLLVKGSDIFAKGAVSSEVMSEAFKMGERSAC